MKKVKIKFVGYWPEMKPESQHIFRILCKNYDIEIIDYDYDFDSDKIANYNVGEILPVLIKVNNGVEVKRLVGEHNKEELMQFIEG